MPAAYEPVDSTPILSINPNFANQSSASRYPCDEAGKGWSPSIFPDVSSDMMNVGVRVDASDDDHCLRRLRVLAHAGGVFLR